MEVELLTFTITLGHRKEEEIKFNGWQSSGITETTMKGTYELEKLNLLVSVDPLELDDTIDRLRDYISLPPEESVAHFVT